MEKLFPIIKQIALELHGNFSNENPNEFQIIIEKPNMNEIISIKPNIKSTIDNYTLKLTNERYIKPINISEDIHKYHQKLSNEATQNKNCGVLPKIDNDTITAYCEHNKDIVLNSDELVENSPYWKTHKNILKDDIHELEKTTKNELKDLLSSVK